MGPPSLAAMNSFPVTIAAALLSLRCHKSNSRLLLVVWVELTLGVIATKKQRKNSKRDHNSTKKKHVKRCIIHLIPRRFLEVPSRPAIDNGIAIAATTRYH